jgi:hypothetical protein
MFNGDLLITDSPSFQEEWETLPVDSGPIGKTLSAIYCPNEFKEIQIIPLFSGFELTPELNAHITYDIDIYDPKGQIIGQSKDHLGLKWKIPSRYLVQKADSPIVLKLLGPQGKQGVSDNSFFVEPGIYRIQILIKDQIGKKGINITKTLEVLPPEEKI